MCAFIICIYIHIAIKLPCLSERFIRAIDALHFIMKLFLLKFTPFNSLKIFNFWNIFFLTSNFLI